MKWLYELEPVERGEDANGSINDFLTHFKIKGDAGWEFCGSAPSPFDVDFLIFKKPAE